MYFLISSGRKGSNRASKKMAKLKAEAKDGTLFDVFGLFLAILKDRPRGGKNKGQ